MITRRSAIAAAALPLAGCGRPSEIAGGFTGIQHERGHLLRQSALAGPALAPAATHRTRVVICGAGVAGLAAARSLHLQGIDDFVVLDLEDEAGGNSRGGNVLGIACPLGAHYLPVPGDAAGDVQDLLEELGLRRRAAGRWTYDERYLCHSPQERLYWRGAWQEGLLPMEGVGAATLAQYRRFSLLVTRAQRAAPFSIPAPKGAPAPTHAALAALTMAAWLDREGLDDPQLRWYLDYCCRDDYGCGIATVSAWAGLHYFASRHGFHLPGEGDEYDPVLTWPQGNAWLTARLAAPLGERLKAGRVVQRIAQDRRCVQIDAFDVATRAAQRWQAEHCIVALPLFVAARVVESPPALLRQAAAQARYAPWLVANIYLDEPLRDRPGAAPSWDNVIHGVRGLGYVDAMHQSLDPRPGPTVLSWYLALGDELDGRSQLLQRPWAAWCEQVLAELSLPHPDLRSKARRIDITRYGHAMAVPIPGRLPQGFAREAPQDGRLAFAHSDWASYSIFEEAFTLGHRAGQDVARRLSRVS